MQAAYFQKYKKYLPSKKFSILIVGVVVVLLAAIIITSRFGSTSSFNTPKQLISSQGTVGEIVGRDSNNNGIADWEETLWGFDPAGDGPSNKEKIDAKKAAADITPNDDSAAGTTKTDQFSQELLSTILALNQSGSLTPDILAKVAESVGDSVDMKHTDAETYALSSIKLYPRDTAAAKNAYEADFRNLLAQYDDIDLGSELQIIATVLDGGNESSLEKLLPLARAYSSLAKQLVGLTTPPQVAQNALDLANATAQMGATLIQVRSLYTDVISGMVGIDDYIQASEAADQATLTLATYFSN